MRGLKSKLHFEAAFAYLLILPVVVFIVIFGLIPIVESISYSFTKWTGFGNKTFVGFDNYMKAIFRDATNIKAFGNTFVLTFSCLVINVVFGFLAANFVYRLTGFRQSFARIILFIPYILSFAAVGLLFTFVFSATDMGLLNRVLSPFMDSPFPWMGNEYTAMPALIFTHSWKDLGFAMLLFFSALQAIPKDVLESARIDGATPFQEMFHVKIPLIKSTAQTVIVLGIVRLMLTFTIVRFLSPSGGINKSTEVTATWFYKQAFEFYDYGYATAIAIILAVVVGLFTVLIRRVIRSDGSVL